METVLYLVLPLAAAIVSAAAAYCVMRSSHRATLARERASLFEAHARLLARGPAWNR